MMTLDELLASAKRELASMTQEEHEAMWERQIAGIVRAEMSWPKPNKRVVNGAVVYDSYEDYCND